jgi:ABC-type multidrug transport system ATPase subunit
MLNQSEAQFIEQYTTLLQVLDLQNFAQTKAKFLSGGNKRKLCIALALLSRPRLVLLDEPTSGLDPIARRKLLSYLRQSQVTALIVTQRVEEADEFCDRVIIMKDGQILE